MMQRRDPMKSINQQRRKEITKRSGLNLNEAQRLMQKVKSWAKVEELLTIKTTNELRDFINDWSPVPEYMKE
jgi:signal recognition particle GTPase